MLWIFRYSGAPARHILMAALLAWAAGTTVAFAQAYRTPIGFDRLTNSFSVSPGPSIRVTQVEATDGPGHMVDTNDAEFIGKTFRNATTGTNGISVHATTVGRYLYGTNSSIAPGIQSITVYEVGHWIGTGFLNDGGGAPAIETNHIQNHSWAGETSAATSILRRIDFAIARDDFTAVVTLGNDSNAPIDSVPSSAYNTLCVGRSDGQHSSGTTQTEGPGRTKPDLVVPQNAASFAAPVAAAAAALLVETALTGTNQSDAAHAPAIRAILMAGATKDEFPDWDRQPGRPLDEHFGAGELNIFNSHRILLAGRQASSTTNTVNTPGWDYASITAGVDRTYFFTVPPLHVARTFSAVLAWNRIVTDPPGGGFNPQVSLPDLSLRLFSATGFAVTTEIDVSTSTVDNVEHVFVRQLGPGSYALQVHSTSNTPYALAWFGPATLKAAVTRMALTNGLVQLTAEVDSNCFYAVEFASTLAGAPAWQTVHAERSTGTTLVYDSTNPPPASGYYRVAPEP